MKLGLKTNEVELFDHQIEWENYSQEKIDQIRNLFGNIIIGTEHIGSTSIKANVNKLKK